MAPSDPSIEPQRLSARLSAESLSLAETVDGATTEPTADPLAPNSAAPPLDAPDVPGYSIVREIAHGGMGRVYAGHDLTLDREVAIKTLLPGAQVERFVTEAKITAKLPHPGVPPVHALGNLADGTPWLAMKLIRGCTLGKLLQDRLAPDENLPRFVQIFEQIAQAVGFAHSRGIIHRDLKPANVMVGEFGEVQVMDWGLARDANGSGNERFDAAGDAVDERLTLAGAVMGTPGYMAPEQARGEAVDRRADVFALGSILAATLTGKPAILGTTARESIEKSAAGDLAEVVARLDECGADAELVALAKRCLAARVDDRPESGQAVADAVAEYRTGVEARLRRAETDRARAETQASEQAKRRRVVQRSAVVVATVLLLGLAVSLWQTFRATHAERVAVDERNRKDDALRAEEKAKKEADSKRLEAERNLGFAKQGNAILGSVFAGLDPRAKYSTLSELSGALKANLLQAVAELERSAIGDPLAVAQMQSTLGASLLGLGEAKLAIEVLEKARSIRIVWLGPDHRDTLACTNNLALGYLNVGKIDLAIAYLQESLRLSKAKFGPEHLDTLSVMNNLAACYGEAGRRDLALPLYKETLKLRKTKLAPGHPAILASTHNLAVSYKDAGQFDLALPLYKEALEFAKAAFAPDHPDVLACMHGLAVCYSAAGRHDLALPLCEDTLKLRKIKLGFDHTDTLITMNVLASCYHSVGQFDLALPMYEESFKLTKAKLGPAHIDSLTAMNNLAEGYKDAGHLEWALPIHEEAFKLAMGKLGHDHPRTLGSMNNLALCYQLAKRFEKSVAMFESLLPLQEKKLGRKHPETQITVFNTGVNYKQVGRLAEAIALLEEAFETRKGIAVRRRVGIALLDAYVKANKATEGTELIDRMLAELRKGLSNDKIQLGEYLGHFGKVCLDVKRYSKAESLLRETLNIHEEFFPETWLVNATQSMLGEATLGQRKLAAAESLLVKGYDGMKALEKSIPPAESMRIPDALDRLIELYTATNRPEKVQTYRELRAKYAPKPTAK